MNKDKHDLQIDLIDSIIHTEYEISSCINACNATQRRALNLINEIRSFSDSKSINLKSSLFNQLEQSISPLMHNTNDNNLNIVLPLIKSTLHSIRIRLEKGLNRKKMLNSFIKSSSSRRNSQVIKHAIQIRALIEQLNYLKTKLKNNQAERAKCDLLIEKYNKNQCDNTHKYDNIDDIDFLLEERMKMEMEIELLTPYIAKIKKQLATQYGSIDSKNQYESLSEEFTSLDDTVCKISKNSIGIQTCCAQTGFKSDTTTQTIKTTFKPVTLSTQTRSALSTSILSTSLIKKKYNNKNWFRQDLQLPFTKNGKKSKHKESKGKVQRFMTRWYFNIDNKEYCVEIRYTNNIKHAPQVILNGIHINFEKSLKTFRRIFDQKNWRILIKLYNSNITIKSANSGKYDLMIDGVSFERLKQNIVNKQWN